MRGVRRSLKVKQALAICALLLLISVTAQATLYNFDIFTDNGGFDYSGDPGADFSVDVFNGAGTAKFKIMNNSTVGGIITSVYFDNGTVLSMAASPIFDFSGTVVFEQPATPSELPGANLVSPVFETTVPPSGPSEAFSIDSAAPVSNGIDPGEYVTILFNLQPGFDINDTIAAMNDGSLRIGLHIQSFDDALSTSQSAVTPEPATLLMLGLGSLMAIRRRKRGK